MRGLAWRMMAGVLLALLLCANAYGRGRVRVPWDFYVYTQPDFRSETLGRFEPQEVSVLAHGENGWVMTSSYRGYGWVNLTTAPAICELDGFFRAMGRDVAVFYKNLDTGFTYIHNPDRVFFAASLSKSNHALYVYTLAERGLIDIYETHEYTRADAWGGTGVMRFMPFGLEFTTRELLGLSIRESDNAAYRMLVRQTRHAAFSYHDFVAEIGANPAFIRDVISQNTSAADAGLFMYAIFNYIESESQFGHYLKYDMLNTAQTSHPYFTRGEGSYGRGGTDGRLNIRMIQADYPVARKYGWARRSFHDAAIVYAPSPYILVILSNMDGGAHQLFEDISRFVQDFNNRFFVSPTPLNAPLHTSIMTTGQVR